MSEELEDLDSDTYFIRNQLPDVWHRAPRSSRRVRKDSPNLPWTSVSASQIQSYLNCPRSWHFRSIQKVPSKVYGSQSLGTVFHAFMEQRMQGLSDPDPQDYPSIPAADPLWDKARDLAGIAMTRMPQSNPQFRFEHGFKMPTYEGGPTFTGFIDLAVPEGLGWEQVLIPTRYPIIVDYKTTSDFRWAMTPAELARNVQMMSYAKWALGEHPDGLMFGEIPHPVGLVHVYALTKGKTSPTSVRFATATVSPEEIETKWQETLVTIRRMEKDSACTSITDVVALGRNNGHCQAYGGCPYRDQCPLTLNGSNTRSMPNSPENPPVTGSSMLQRLRERAQSSTPSTGSLVGPITLLLAKLEAQGKGTPSLTGAVMAAYIVETGRQPVGDAIAGVGELATRLVSTLGELAVLAGGEMTVVPPDAPSRETGAIVDGEKTVTVEPVKVVAQDPVASEPKKRGRPAKGTKPTTESSGPRLFVGCAPVGSDAVDFATWVQPVLRRIEELEGISDWRLIPYTSKAVLAKAIRDHLSTAGVPDQMTLDLRISGAEVAYEVLAPMASEIIRAWA